MTTRHTISTAKELYAGAANYTLYSPDGRPGVQLAQLHFVNLGSPDTADTDAICDGVTCATDAATSITLLTDTLDVPRALVVDSSDDTQVDGVVTITGADVYGATMVEEITANGTTAVNGKKAFKTITSISVAACTSAGTIDIGTTNILGLPVRIDAARQVVNPAGDASVEDFTIVVADTDQDATAGDCRGTVVPAGTPNNVINFSCLVHITDTSTKATAFGVDQYSG